ncbi:hypothetical protein MY11210_008326 [Beauveria gryllotalpidicola]
MQEKAVWFRGSTARRDISPRGEICSGYGDNPKAYPLSSFTQSKAGSIPKIQSL